MAAKETADAILEYISNTHNVLTINEMPIMSVQRPFSFYIDHNTDMVRHRTICQYEIENKAELIEVLTLLASKIVNVTKIDLTHIHDEGLVYFVLCS